jgi:O-antigen/teichoic acid export membrane protein
MLLNRIKHSNATLLKLLSLGGQAAARIAGSLATVKILAFQLVPAQFVIYGQLQTLMQMYSGISSSIGSAKLSALIAKGEDYRDKGALIDTAVGLVIVVTTVLSFITIVFSTSIAHYLGFETHTLPIYLLPIGAFAVAYVGIVQAFFTGTGEIHRFSKNSMVAMMIVTVVTVILSYFFGLAGALLSISCAPIAACIFVCIFDNPLSRPKISRFHVRSGMELGGFATASIIIAVGYYASQIYIRSEYARQISSHEAGLLVAASRISDVYMGIIAVFFSNLLTRTYAGIKQEERIAVIARVYSIVAGILVPGAVCAALTSHFWMPALLSAQYLESAPHMRMQMLADTLKCVYWVGLYYVISKHRVRTYFLIEFAGLIIFLVAAISNPFHSPRFAPQIAQILEYGILIVAVNAVVIAKKR